MIRRTTAFIVGVLGALVLAGPALAGPGQPSLTLHDPFTEKGRFTVRNLTLEGESNVLSLERGGRVRAQLDLVQHCPGCGGSINQIIIGLAGEPRAQACVYNGGGVSAGWQRAEFTLDIPDQPGIYEIRARYAQADGCGGAMNWWRVDRPQGPSGDATIGLVFVAGAEPERSLQDVQRDIDATLTRLRENTDRLVRITRKRMSPPKQIEAAQLSGEASELVRSLEALQAEALAFGQPGHDHERPHHPKRPRPAFVIKADPLPQHIVVVQAPPPVAEPVIEPMRDGEYQKLVKTLKKQGFESTQLDYLRDVLRTEPWFTTQQAVGLMKVFSFSSGQVETAALVCKRIVEPGAFPSLVSVLTWDSDRDTLRQRTGGVCGLPGM